MTAIVNEIKARRATKPRPPGGVLVGEKGKELLKEKEEKEKTKTEGKSWWRL